MPHRLFYWPRRRQAARDKTHADADALHREALADSNEQRLSDAAQNAALVLTLLQQNTELTEHTKQLSERIEMLTIDMHKCFLEKKQPG